MVLANAATKIYIVAVEASGTTSAKALSAPGPMVVAPESHDGDTASCGGSQPVHARVTLEK
jgi:hypothetical protein